MIASRAAAALTTVALSLMSAGCDDPDSVPSAPHASVSADEVTYDRSATELGADNVQAALDELAARSSSHDGSIVSLAQSSEKVATLSATIEAQATKIVSLEGEIGTLTADVEELKELLDSLKAEEVAYDDSVTELGATTVQEAMEAAAAVHGELSSMAESGDSEVLASVTTLEEKQEAMQEQIDAPPGPRPCPEDMEPANEAFCVEVAQEAKASFLTAISACYNRGRRLCTVFELTIGCQKLGEAGGFGDETYEWSHNILGYSSGPADEPIASFAAYGGGSCLEMIKATAKYPVDLHPFRCCITR